MLQQHVRRHELVYSCLVGFALFGVALKLRSFGQQASTMLPAMFGFTLRLECPFVLVSPTKA